MKVTSYKFKVRWEDSDPSVGIMTRGISQIDCQIIVQWEDSEDDDWEDEAIDEANDYVKESEGVKPGVLKWKITKTGTRQARLTVNDWDDSDSSLRHLREMRLTKVMNEALRKIR